MSQYWLSFHPVQGEAPPPMTPEEMRAVMECVQGLESEMKASGTFVFGGRLHDVEAATVVRRGAPGLVMTDGPFVESKEHIGGVYVVGGAGLDGPRALGGELGGETWPPMEVGAGVGDAR